MAPAHPWLVPHNPWERIHVDHAQWKKWLLLVAVEVTRGVPSKFYFGFTDH